MLPPEVFQEKGFYDKALSSIDIRGFKRLTTEPIFFDWQKAQILNHSNFSVTVQIAQHQLSGIIDISPTAVGVGRLELPIYLSGDYKWLPGLLRYVEQNRAGLGLNSMTEAAAVGKPPTDDTAAALYQNLGLTLGARYGQCNADSFNLDRKGVKYSSLTVVRNRLDLQSPTQFGSWRVKDLEKFMTGERRRAILTVSAMGIAQVIQEDMKQIRISPGLSDSAIK